jgi:hypothetical protein
MHVITPISAERTIANMTARTAVGAGAPASAPDAAQTREG